MKELILKKITLRKRWSLSIFITCTILMWAGLFILLYYAFSDDNSYLNFPFLLILFICLVFSTLGIYMFKFFNAYITTVNQLSERNHPFSLSRESYAHLPNNGYLLLLFTRIKCNFLKYLISLHILLLI